MGTILLVDDAPQVAGIIVSKLGREGFEVIWKRDGESALEFLKDRRPDLVMLATYLEKRNAWEVLRTLRARQPELPVLMILEQEEAGETARAKALGCADCIVKPFKPTALARTVREALERVKAGEAGGPPASPLPG